MAHPALTDVSVLSKVFQFLVPTEVKQIRTVCKDWEGPATSILGKLTIFNLKSVFKDDGFRNVLRTENLNRIKVESIQELHQNNFARDKASSLFLEMACKLQTRNCQGGWLDSLRRVVWNHPKNLL